jgi:hypothetical protein
VGLISVAVRVLFMHSYRSGRTIKFQSYVLIARGLFSFPNADTYFTCRERGLAIARYLEVVIKSSLLLSRFASLLTSTSCDEGFNLRSCYVKSFPACIDHIHTLPALAFLEMPRFNTTL